MAETDVYWCRHQEVLVKKIIFTMIFNFGIHILDSIVAIFFSFFIKRNARVLFCLFIDLDKTSFKMTTINCVCACHNLIYYHLLWLFTQCWRPFNNSFTNQDLKFLMCSVRLNRRLPVFQLLFWRHIVTLNVFVWFAIDLSSVSVLTTWQFVPFHFNACEREKIQDSFVAIRFRFRSSPFSSLDFHTLVIVVPAKWRKNRILITRIDTMKSWFGEVGMTLFPKSKRSWEPGWDRDRTVDQRKPPLYI